MTQSDNDICMFLLVSNLRAAHGLEEQQPPPSFPSDGSQQPLRARPNPTGGGPRGCKPSLEDQLPCRSLVQLGPGKQQQSPVLYSPMSALQNACCGCTGAQLHASTSFSARHTTSSASVQRMPLTVNGIFEKHWCESFRPLLLLLRRCVAVWIQRQAARQRPPSFFLISYWRRQQHRAVCSGTDVTVSSLDFLPVSVAGCLSFGCVLS